MQGWTGTEEHAWGQGKWMWINAPRPYCSDRKMRLRPMTMKFVMDENGNDTGVRLSDGSPWMREFQDYY